MSKLRYWKRILRAYLTKTPSYLDFWHERPEEGNFSAYNLSGEYYMTFSDKADYAGPRDSHGVILFDYLGDIGVRYNPLAIAQYGIARLNSYVKTKNETHLKEARIHADWLVNNLFDNSKGIPVWKHNFSWRYKEVLKPGWYSALSQGAGISLLARLGVMSGDKEYVSAAKKAFVALDTDIENGGVKCVDSNGFVWLEEYIVSAPTHILNGFIWALWGVKDYWILTNEPRAGALFGECIETLKKHLHLYDAGFWSLYDLSKQSMLMVASPFYHRLHIVQMNIMEHLTGENIFGEYGVRFEKYGKNLWKRILAFSYKAVFKLLYF
ncbi:hypothetical protein A3I34_01370 [Candidatus Jorgensenbacteria bacterium RIFCSPLOWO2_02_FULL_45_12]|uniref:D-glucuronyl C5-epimerase C-terminal domain-containing protein n=2 Tax=Candidatus Joergenseniibacteriota TaxID=1752739 RepID=A0A1F6BMZ4_9BACT|nr:MAG: hypothetical protein A3D55_02045 [Candidatus Jorgensenbacteria bacterium RIFCSPHIGHO2_02_FULL_45_20]OGG42677.1 MAG: hypothetical protein A3I34_01370 [Candidatus Jorgensenbacteria bacterium RIFCSPLOWO2_02_FULL_45_12]